jgi:translation initiation factor 1A
MGDYGDFEEVVEEGAEPAAGMPVEQTARVRLPRGEEKVGIVVQRLGANKMNVKLADGKLINCRVPGRFKRSMWLRLKDIVLIEPWEFDKEKADVIFKYSSGQIIQLRKKGLLNGLNDGF